MMATTCSNPLCLSIPLNCMLPHCSLASHVLASDLALILPSLGNLFLLVLRPAVCELLKATRLHAHVRSSVIHAGLCFAFARVVMQL